MNALDPDEQRASLRENWEAAAAGWGRLADRVREWGMPVSQAMIKALALQPGERVLELAAGPGDTGFMAAGLIRRPGDAEGAPGEAPADDGPPPGTLICSDGAEPMLEIARRRARQAGIDNVQFRQLELEWIDLPTAAVDAVLCRWGIMLVVDPEAAAREIRRVLRPSGRAALAVWDVAERNPWATIPGSVMVDLGHAEPPDPRATSMFSLGEEGRLAELLADAGFVEIDVRPVGVQRQYPAVAQYVEETTHLSPGFGPTFAALDAAGQAEVSERIATAVQPFTSADGAVCVPGTSLVARAIA